MTIHLGLTDNTDHFDSTENLALKRRIANHLQRRFPNLDTIEIEAHRGTVILRGTVSSVARRWRCVDSCRYVAGVVNVIDRLVILYCLPMFSKTLRAVGNTQDDFPRIKPHLRDAISDHP